MRRELEAELSRLPQAEREALVLRFVAGLSEEQVADLLGVPVRTVGSPAPAEDFRTASESIDVLAAPFDLVVAEARAQRRRHRRIVVAGVTVAALVVTGIGWLATRPPAEEPPSDLHWSVERQRNPVDVPWYAGGRLHLARVVVRMPAVGELVAVGDGAAFTGAEAGDDGLSTVYFAASDGAVTELGHAAEGAGLAASDQTDWVAWVDPSDDDAARIVVHNLVSGEDFATLELPDGGAVVAVDQARVYYATPEGDFLWEPGEDPMPLDRSGLLAVTSGAQAYAVDGGIEMVQSFYSTAFVRPGTGAVISPGGNFVLSRAGDGSAPFRPLLYDARSGERLRSGLSAGELALDATFGPNHTASYLVVPRADVGSAPDLDGNSTPLVVLRTCDLAPVVCHDVIPLARPGEKPLLAQ